MLNIHFNGKQVKVAEGTTLAELLESHRISRRNLFVDWNDTILYGNDDLEHRPLGNGDRFNLFSMVGGG